MTSSHIDNISPYLLMLVRLLLYIIILYAPSTHTLSLSQAKFSSSLKTLLVGLRVDSLDKDYHFIYTRSLSCFLCISSNHNPQAQFLTQWTRSTYTGSFNDNTLSGYIPIPNIHSQGNTWDLSVITQSSPKFFFRSNYDYYGQLTTEHIATLSLSLCVISSLFFEQLYLLIHLTHLCMFPRVLCSFL